MGLSSVRETLHASVFLILQNLRYIGIHSARKEIVFRWLSDARKFSNLFNVDLGQVSQRLCSV